MRKSDLQMAVSAKVARYMNNNEHLTKEDGLYKAIADEIELPILEALMERAQENQSAAAKMSGLCRGTFRELLKKHEML